MKLEKKKHKFNVYLIFIGFTAKILQNVKLTCLSFIYRKIGFYFPLYKTQPT